METFQGMVTEEPTNLGLARIEDRKVSIGGERVYGGG